MEDKELGYAEGFVLCRTLQLQGGDVNAAATSLTDAEHTHKLAYLDWKPANYAAGKSRVVVAVHGLTRNSHDFDTVAQALVKDGFRVVAVDMPGRWNSERVPAANYSYPQYIHDVKTLVHHLGLKKIDWLGTSMGGFIGMLVAAQQDPQGTVSVGLNIYVHPFEIEHMIMNDIGPFVPATGLHRLGTYVGRDMQFKSLEEVGAYVRKIAAQFGPLTDEEWDKVAKHSIRPIQGGGEFAYELHYDPAIASSIPTDPSKLQDIDLWEYWEHVKCGSLLLLRGADSDILPRHVADEMVKRAKFPMRIHEFPGVGHAPPILNDEQVQVVRHFFLSGPAAEE